ncbi:hypothetical protein Ddc_12014 [Ditylenchus destructor]|nr:hypothetical protein Ddc_12014 [Ditylenchus destructor]
MIGALSAEKKMSSEKRHSINPKTSTHSGTEPSTTSPATAVANTIANAPPQTKLETAVGLKNCLAGRLSHQLTPPRLVEKAKPISTSGGQLFLCIIGTLLSISVCVWLAFFSSDLKWRRAIFASAAAICSVMFILLAIATFRKNSKSHHDIEIAPHVFRHRRSTTGSSTVRRNTKTNDELLPTLHPNGNEIHRQSSVNNKTTQASLTVNTK